MATSTQKRNGYKNSIDQNEECFAFLRIVTWNCQNLKTNIEGIKELCKKADIVCLQETWLEEFELGIVNTIDKEFRGQGFSGMIEDRDIKKGRPYGGIMVLWRKTVVDCVKNVKVDGSKRIMSMEIMINGTKFNVINVYAPSDGKGVDSHLAMYNFWGALNAVIEVMEGELLIVAGDFNTDYYREGIFRDIMMDNLKENQLVYGDNENDRKVTFVSKINGAQSWIDHFLVSSKIQEMTRNVMVLEGIVGSDHQPLFLQFELGRQKKIIGRKTQQMNTNDKVLNWKSVDPQTKQNYAWEVTEMLQNAAYPEVFLCTKEKCSDESHKKDLNGVCFF